MGKRGLCISGGGAWGACGAGTLAALNKEYDLISGVSTGSLMAPLVALREWDRLKTAYTSVSQADIFSVNPFQVNGKINVWNALWRLAAGKKTLGESQALRKTLDRFLTAEDFLRLNALGKEVIVACQETSFSPERIYYFSSTDTQPADFLDWMWASANAPVVTSLLYKALPNGIVGEFCDGGVSELISLTELLKRGATEIDVILHRFPAEPGSKGFVKDFFHNVLRLFSIQRHELEDNDLMAGLSSAQIRRCIVTVYYLPCRLSDNSLLFDQAKMEEWYQLGYRTALFPERKHTFDYRQWQPDFNE